MKIIKTYLAMLAIATVGANAAQGPPSPPTVGGSEGTGGVPSWALAGLGDAFQSLDEAFLKEQVLVIFRQERPGKTDAELMAMPEFAKGLEDIKQAAATAAAPAVSPHVQGQITLQSLRPACQPLRALDH